MKSNAALNLLTRRRPRGRRLPRRTGPASTLLLGLLAVAGCGHGGTIRAHLHPRVARPQPGVVIFLADGLPPRFVEQGCAEGWLPNIKQRFWDGGVRVRRATTTLPAITYAGIASWLTGAGPSRTGIIGNRWFDPDEALFRNYVSIKYHRFVNDDCRVPTIYERIRPAPSASIQAAHHRGATLNIANWAVSGVMWYFHDYTAVDKLTASSIPWVAGWANWTGRWPTILTCYFPGLDSIGHTHGASSEEFRWAAEHADRQIGRVCDWLESQGLLETTYIVLVSDHGMVDVGRDGYIKLLPLIRDQWGRKATDEMYHLEPLWLRKPFYDHYDTVIDDRDGRRASIHFRGPGGWQERPTPQMVDDILTAPPLELRLWNIEGVELVAYLARDDEAVLRTPLGEARVRCRNGTNGSEYAYLPVPSDALGYLADPGVASFVTASFHGSRDWLAATAEQESPDLVPHIIPLLQLRRAGQVVLFAKPGYSFNLEAGGHGGIHRDERLVTFLMAGPGISPRSTIDCARSVDLVPTLLDLLGIDHGDDDCLEGVSLLKAGLLSGGQAQAAP